MLTQPGEGYTMGRKTRLPSPALVVACLALIVALTGTAVAAGIVANARHANKADVAVRALDADKVGGKTAVQIAAAGAAAGAQLAGPASTAAGLITVKSTQWTFAAGGAGDVAVACDTGQKAIAGGFEDPGGFAHPRDTRPSADGAAWHVYVTVSPNAPSEQSGTVDAVCLE
jgi:hypothetical protein